jgi:hypothetical protein
MSKAGVSMTVYAIYLGSSGLGLALIPNVLLHVLGVPPTHEGWIRIFGSLAVVLAAKGYNAARLNLVPSLQFDVYTRTGFGIFLTVIVVLGLVPPIMVIFAIADILASVWTQLALLADKRSERLGAT